MTLIDTHQHLIWRKLFGYDWTAGIPALAEGDFTPRHYLALTEARGISGAIFVEAGVNDADYKAEARHVAKLVGQDGLLGLVASCRPEEDEGFDAWLDECVGLGVNGFRRVLHVVDDDLSRSDTFRANLRKIGRKGLTFDVIFMASKLPIAVDLARACDAQTLIVDHCGNPDIAKGGFEHWAASMRALAGLPHVNVKLSGVMTQCPAGAANAATLRPYFEHLLDCFGADRIVWGSDWPVVNLASGLADWIDVTHALLAPLTDIERARIGAENARRLYGLG